MAAVADLNPDNLIDAAAAGVPVTTTDYREILAMDDVQAVYVITPQYVHKDIVLDVIAAGKDVYCEETHGAESRGLPCHAGCGEKGRR